MKIENQVCSLEQAKRLKQLGVSQNSLFYYNTNSAIKDDNHLRFFAETGAYKHFGKVKDAGVIRYFSAFSVAELGVMLPAGYDSMSSTGIGWRCYDVDGEDDGNIYATEAEARAAMLINLIENNLVSVLR